MCQGVYLIIFLKRPLLLGKFKPLKWFIGLSWILPGVIVGIWAWLMMASPGGRLSCFEYEISTKYNVSSKEINRKEK